MSQERADALRDRQALGIMMDSDGWRVFCQRHDARFAELTADLLNPTTPKDDAENLRQARAVIDDRFSPRKLAMDLMKKFEAVIARTTPPAPTLPEGP